MSKQHPRLSDQPFSSIPIPACNGRARPFLQFLAATDRARHPSGSSERRATVACRPGGFATPEELWYRNASNGSHKFEGCRLVGANPWLARIAGGPLYCTSGTATRHPIQLLGLQLQSTYGLAGRRRSFKRSSASYQRVCAPSECGNTRARAYAPEPCARESDSSWLSYVRRSAWLRRKSAARSWPPQ